MSTRCFAVLAVSAAGLLSVQPCLANDGLDRYRGPTPAELRLFDPPLSAEAGYRFLPADSLGGADGDRAFRWARGAGIAAVRLAARRVAATLGSGDHPMAIFDLSSENGDTPVTFAPPRAPRGRHPGGSHDGGTNLDLGYYLTSLDGRAFTPDYAACTDHFVDSSDGGGPIDSYQCRGPADRLDVDREALFLLELVRLHHQGLGDGLIEQIGIDGAVARAVTERLDGWARQRRYGATRTLVGELTRRLTSDRFDGWSRSHHHHIHLRLQRLADHGPARSEIEALLQAEADLDAELAPGTGPALLTRVESYGLSRSIEISLVRAQGVQRCEYRLTGQDRFQPGSAEEPGFRHVFGLDHLTQPGRAGRTIEVEARLVLESGQELSLSRQVDLPRQDPELWIGVRAEQIRVSARVADRTLRLCLDMPRPFFRYVTEVEYEVLLESGERLTGQGARTDSSPVCHARIELPEGSRELVLGRAWLELSGRMRLAVPFHF